MNNIQRILANEKVKLQGLARLLAEELEIDIPHKTNEQDKLVEIVDKYSDTIPYQKTTKLEHASQAYPIEELESGSWINSKSVHLGGTKVPWGASNQTIALKPPGASIWQLEDASLLNWKGQMFYFDSEKKLITNISSKWWPLACRTDAFIHYLENPAGKVLKGFAPIADDNYVNFCHWLVDVFPRIIVSPKSTQLLLPKLDLIFHNQSIDMIGSTHRIGQLDDLQAIEIKKLYIIDNMGEQLKHPASKGAKWAINALQQLRCISNHPKTVNTFGDKIYISRGNLQKRRLIEESNVEETLAKLNVTPIALENLSFQDQVAVFSNAKLVVGLHGAGLSGVSIMQDESNLLEIHGDKYGTPAFRILANANNVNYFSLTGENLGEKQNNRSDVSVDPIEVSRATEYILNGIL